MENIKKMFKIKNSDNTYNYKKIIWLGIITIVFLGIGTSFGLYAFREVRNFYFATKKFYFKSDKLTEEGAVYKIENWAGVGSYPVTINMNSYENNNLYSEEDIDYDISYNCSTNVTCSSVDNKTNGTILASNNSDSFTIVISVPTNTKFNTGDKVSLEVTANSTSPYRKKLSATFTLVVGQYGLSYSIEDKVNSPYLDVRITNTLDYYVVKEAFDGYEVGSKIDVTDYLNLDSENKNKCASAIITLKFDPNKVLLDMTNKNYLSAIDTNTVKINNYDYINELSFKIDALSSEMVKFYKVDTSLDYTYPNGIDDSSIVTVTYS